MNHLKNIKMKYINKDLIEQIIVYDKKVNTDYYFKEYKETKYFLFFKKIQKSGFYIQIALDEYLLPNDFFEKCDDLMIDSNVVYDKAYFSIIINSKIVVTLYFNNNEDRDIKLKSIIESYHLLPKLIKFK